MSLVQCSFTFLPFFWLLLLYSQFCPVSWCNNLLPVLELTFWITSIALSAWIPISACSLTTLFCNKILGSLESVLVTPNRKQSKSWYYGKAVYYSKWYDYVFASWILALRSKWRVLRKHTYCKGEFDLFIVPPDRQIAVMQVTQVTQNIFL